MSDASRYSVLDEPLFRVTLETGEERGLTLPEVLVQLSSGDVASFVALQFHQRQAWHCFLVQLATLALARDGRHDLNLTSDQWRALLVSLAEGSEDCWCLLVEDVARPAFLQPPVPEGSLKAAHYKADLTTPDELDMLVTSKNHDIKMKRITSPRIEHWIYALVTLQTMDGFLGQGNYGISRMNGGFGNRPLVELCPSLSWGGRFRRDVEVLLTARARLAEEFSYDLEGIALLWLQPWDGSRAAALPLERCDPLFIEICRRIRFVQSGGALRCLRANSRGPRVAVREGADGAIGDPWTPIDKKAGKALTVGERGFTYRLLQEILFSGNYVRPPALEATEAESDGALATATTLVRGQGVTGGWHRRVVPVPASVIRLFGSPTEREKLAARAKLQVDLASEVQKKVLTVALFALMKAGSEGNVDWAKLNRWAAAYDAEVDDVFFDDLWASVPLAGDEASVRWKRRILGFARTQLNHAIRSTPLPSVRRYRAISAAESSFSRTAAGILKNEEPTGNYRKEEE